MSGHPLDPRNFCKLQVNSLPVFKTHFKLSSPVVTLESDKTPKCHKRNSPAPGSFVPCLSSVLTLSCSKLCLGMRWLKAKLHRSITPRCQNQQSQIWPFDEIYTNLEWLCYCNFMLQWHNLGFVVRSTWSLYSIKMWVQVIPTPNHPAIILTPVLPQVKPFC